MADPLRRLIDAHYGSTDLSARILERLRDAGKDLLRVTRDDLAPFDEFHTGGRPATRALAVMAALPPGSSVIDVGCGVGGPARTLAAEFGCRVTGLDLTAEFCRAAALLNRLVGLQDRVAFVQGDAGALPFADGTFDAAWSQNAIMNVAAKGQMLGEVRRVLRPGGTFALAAAAAGPVPAPHYPTFWASSPAFSFLPTTDELRALIGPAGFVEESWKDSTAETLDRSRARLDALAAEAGHPLGRSTIVASDVEAKIENGFRNLAEGRVLALRAILRAA
jgi:SAM-dependent methyltransferase